MSVQSEIVQWNLCALTCEHAVYLLKHAERTCISATLFAMAMDIHTHTHTQDGATAGLVYLVYFPAGKIWCLLLTCVENMLNLLYFRK